MASLKEVKVPDIGDFDAVPIVEVLVSKGDEVAAEDPLVTLESDKASMDIPAPFAGKVAELKCSVGDEVSEGAVLMTIEADGGGEGGDGDEPDEGAEEDAAQEEDDADAEGRESEPADAPESPSEPAGSDDPVYAGPGARKKARELGVKLEEVEGSGRKGRITSQDVESAARSPSKGDGGGGAAGLDLAPWPEVDFAEFGEIEVKKLPRIKQIAGPYLQRNWVMIPHVTQHDDADITGLEDFRVRTNEEAAERGVKLTMVALLLKACVATLREFPEFNASLDGTNLIVKKYFHLGFAADTPNGLVVPVIRDIDSKGLFEIAEELKELSGKAREGKLGPKEMQGGTFTISSLGGIGGTYFTPIINAPEVAILGIGRSKTKPVWDGSEFKPRLMLPLSLSYDHRVIDGAAAARFTTHLAGVLVDLRQVLL